MFDIKDLRQILAIIISVALGVLIRMHTFSTRAPDLRVFWIFQVGSFFMAMVWIYFLCNIIVDLLILFGMLTGIHASLLGLTVMSWGNSLGDAIASASVSAHGFSEMAFTGCIAGSVFNLLLALGLTLLWAHRSTSDPNEGIEFKAVDNEGRATLLIIVSTICTLVVLVVLIAVNNWYVAKWHAKILVALYSFTVGTAIFIYF